MAKMLTTEQVVKLMKQRQGARTQKQFAEELGISQQYLCDIYKGSKEPGESALRAMGLERQIRYLQKAS